jgi:ABC-type uncharacterized transport system YnjBCD permease subunit
MMLAAAVAPTAATLVFEWTTGRMPENLTRAAAGAVLGLALGALVTAAIPARSQVPARTRTDRPPASLG